MVSTIYVTRHGYRSNWVQNVPVPPSPTGLSIDPVLADHGVDQAEQLGVYLKDIEPKIQRIYCSPFYRCLQTVQPTAKALKIPILVENGVGEWFQELREGGLSPASVSTLKQHFPEIDESYKPAVIPSVEGESQAELFSRCMLTVSKVVQDLSTNHPEVDTILFVCHAAPKAALGVELTGDDNLVVRTGVCSVDKYTLKPGKSGRNRGDWTIVVNGYTGHLKDGEEMHWTFDSLFQAGSDEDIKARRAEAEAKAKAQALGATNTNDDADSTETETVSVYLPLEMAKAQVHSSSGLNTGAVIPTQAEFQSSGLHTDTPLFKIGPNVYQGAWNNMVGTEVFTTNEGEVIGKSRQRILLQPKPLEARETRDEDEDEMHKVSLMDRVREINDSKRNASV